MSVGLPDLPAWPWPGGGDPTTPPVPTTRYLRYPDGHIGQLTVTGADPVIPEGATLLTQEQYEETRTQMLQAHEARLEQLQAAEETARLQQFEDLRAAGIPEATARGLTGYDGPTPQAGDQG